MADEEEIEPTALDILTVYGLAEKVPINAINNACRLASSKLDLVVVFERPSWMAEKYTYDEMFYGARTRAEPGSAAREGCPSLRELNDMITDASKGQYCLDDVAVYHTNLFLPDGEPDETRRGRAHEFFWNLLETAPKTIVVMTAQAGYSSHPEVKRLWSSLENAGEKESFVLGKGGSEKHYNIIRAFHPSIYLRTDYNEFWGNDERELAARVLKTCLAQGLYEATQRPEFLPRIPPQLWQDWKALLKCDSREIMALISVAGKIPDSEAAFMLKRLGSCSEYHISMRDWKSLFEDSRSTLLPTPPPPTS